MNRDQWNLKKIPFVAIYSLVAGWILFSQWQMIFYEVAKDSFGDLPRLYGCIAFSYMGFALLAALAVKTHAQDLAFPWSYVYKYPFLCAVNALAVFVVCQMFDATKGYLFNFTAYPLAFFAGFFSELTLPLLYKQLEKYMNG